jgi:ATP-dependent DNA helicase PIF1
MFSVNADVDGINQAHLENLCESGAPSQTYKPVVNGNTTHQKERILAWCKTLGIPAETTLCEGAQVVVTYNVNPNEGIVNGTRGIVTGLGETNVTIQLVDGLSKTITPVTVTCDDDPSLSVVYLPVKLAWAVTIHRSQGLTMDAVEIDLGSSIFAAGQAYTALSRAKDLDSVCISAFSERAFRADPRVLDFYGVRGI